jgi:hypothetical protein
MLALESTSTWTVTAPSRVTVLGGLIISGSTITNVIGDGHTVYDEAGANTSLAGKTYAHTGGGTVKPA